MEDDHSGDAGLTIAEVFHYIFLFFLIGAILFISIIGLSVSIDARSPVPESLFMDLTFSQLTNYCFVARIDGVEQYGVVDMQLFTEDQLISCFGLSAQDVPFSKVSIDHPQSLTSSTSRTKELLIHTPSRARHDGSFSILLYDEGIFLPARMRLWS